MNPNLQKLQELFEKVPVAVYVKTSDKEAFYFFIENVFQIPIEKSNKSEVYSYHSAIKRWIIVDPEFVPEYSFKYFFWSFKEFIDFQFDEKRQIIQNERILELDKNGYLNAGNFKMGLQTILSPQDLKNIDKLRERV